jgi:hypothetical protein
MKYIDSIQAAKDNPLQLEQLYQSALKENYSAEFKADLEACFKASSENLLYTTWHYRFEYTSQEEQAGRNNINWRIALPLSLLTGLVLWLLSAQMFTFHNPATSLPYLVLLWSPVVGLIIITFLTLTSKQGLKRTLLVCAGLVAITAYIMLLSINNRYYRELMVPHLPLLAWFGILVSIIGLRSTSRIKFALLTKSIEALVTGGVYLIGVFVFAGITTAMFSALGIQLSDPVTRLLFIGGGGLIPIIAIASVYDPTVTPLEQDFKRGLSQMTVLLPRFLLPLTILVLVIYLVVILFNFLAPFQNRDVLIIYNVMLFAVIALLAGATPLSSDDISERYQSFLRNGILLVAVLVEIVSLYALSATLYRTFQGGLTINRTAILGWNIINISLLAVLIYTQLKHGKQAWVDSLHSVFSLAAYAYATWTLFLVAAIPWLFN